MGDFSCPYITGNVVLICHNKRVCIQEMFRQLQSAAIIADMTTPGDQFKWTTFKTQSQTVHGEFQLFSSVRASFPRHPHPSPSFLAFRFDLGEPVLAYGWNLKLRTWPLAVTENHKAFVVRAGFQLQHHGHFAGNSRILGLVWGTSSGQGSRLLQPYRSYTEGRESQPPTHPPGDAPLSMDHVNLRQLLTKSYVCAGVHPVLVAISISSSIGRKASPMLTSSLKKL